MNNYETTSLKDKLIRINTILSENGFVNLDETNTDDTIIEKTKGEKEIKIYLNKDNSISFIIYFSCSTYMRSNNLTNINWLLNMIKKSL